MEDHQSSSTTTNNTIFLVNQINTYLSDRSSRSHLLQLPTVRTIGLLKCFDVSESKATVEDEGSVLHIDTSLIPQFHAHSNTWYTFIGQLEQRNTLLEEAAEEENHAMSRRHNIYYVLKAKIAHEMHGMDSSSIKLWKQSLLARQKFLGANDIQEYNRNLDSWEVEQWQN